MGHLAHELVTSGRRIESVVVPAPPSDLRRFDRLRDNLSTEQHRAFEAADVLVQVEFGLGVPERVPTVLLRPRPDPARARRPLPAPLPAAVPRRSPSGMPVVEAAARRGRRQLYVRNLTRALTRADRVLANSAYTAATARAVRRRARRRRSHRPTPRRPARLPARHGGGSR